VSHQDTSSSAFPISPPLHAGTPPIHPQDPPTPKPVLLDDIPLNRFHVKIAGLTFGAHFTEGYALGTVGYALASMNRQMPLDSFWMGAIGSSALIGIFLGSLVFDQITLVPGAKQ
jgi:putative MFS transporter